MSRHEELLKNKTFVEDLQNISLPSREVVLAHTGDPIENVCNTSSQRDTNDMD